MSRVYIYRRYNTFKTEQQTDRLNGKKTNVGEKLEVLIMTEERVKKIVEAIEAYSDKEKLFAMSPEEAVAALNTNGNDFTLDEIVEAGEGLKAAAQVSSANGEIDIAALEQVSGGANSNTAYYLNCASTACCVLGAACMVAAVCW